MQFKVVLDSATVNSSLPPSPTGTSPDEKSGPIVIDIWIESDSRRSDPLGLEGRESK